MHILVGYTVQISIKCYFQTQSPSDKDLHETVRKVVHLHSLYLIISQAKQLKAYKIKYNDYFSNGYLAYLAILGISFGKG